MTYKSTIYKSSACGPTEITTNFGEFCKETLDVMSRNLGLPEEILIVENSNVIQKKIYEIPPRKLIESKVI